MAAIESGDYFDDYDGINDEDQTNWAKVAFSIIIFVIGLLGNMVVIFIILALREHKKSVTHWYVLQLAIADSLFLLTLPFAVSQDVNHKWIYKEWMCKAKETILFLNCYASIMFLSIMSVDRYIAVCHTFSDTLQRLRRPLAVGIITVITWTLCLCVCTPIIMYSATVGIYPDCHCSYVFPDNYENKSETGKCHGLPDELCLNVENSQKTGTQHCITISISDWLDQDTEYESGFEGADSTTDFTTKIVASTAFDEVIVNDEESTPSICTYAEESSGFRSLMLFNFLVMYIVPICIMVVFYGLIVRRLAASDRVRKSSVSSATKGKYSNSSSSSGNARRRVTIMCAALVASFVLTWLPFHVNHIAKLVGINVPLSKVHICENLAIAGSLMVYFNSALNPYLYTFLGSNFNQRWRNATKSFRRRTSSYSDGITARYNKQAIQQRKNTATSVVTLSAAKEQRLRSMSEGKPSFCTTQFPSMSQTLSPINNVATDEIEATTLLTTK